MEVNKNKNNFNEVNTIDINVDSSEVKKHTAVSFIHVFESEIEQSPEFELIDKKGHKKYKIRHRKTKLRFLPNKEINNDSWTPEMRLGYCKNSIKRFISSSAFENPWDV